MHDDKQRKGEQNHHAPAESMPVVRASNLYEKPSRPSHATINKMVYRRSYAAVLFVLGLF